MYKRKPGQIYLPIGMGKRFSLFLEGLCCSLDCILLSVFLAERHCTTPGTVLQLNAVQSVTWSIGISCAQQNLTEI